MSGLVLPVPKPKGSSEKLRRDFAMFMAAEMYPRYCEV